MGIITVAGSDGSQGPDEVAINDLDKGRFLLILEKAGNVYIPANGNQSALPVVAGIVRWPLKMEDGEQAVPIDLKIVRRQVAVFDLAEKEAYKKGQKAAKAEIEAGIINYVYLPMNRAYLTRKLIGDAKKKFGISVEIMGGGSSLSSLEKQRHRGHQEAVIAFLEEKYGIDPVRKLAKSWELQED